MTWERLPLPDGDVRIRRNFLSQTAADDYFARLRAEVDWRRDSIRLFGRSHPIPRLHQWYSDPGVEYRWSGLRMRPRPWTDALARLRERVSSAVGCSFNSVLVNLYRDGDDSMGWHADDEAELGDQPVIASVSLGAERDFVLRRRDRNSADRGNTIALAHGSLLVMAGQTQRHWQHALPKRRRITRPRINLTFRNCESSELPKPES